MSCRACCMLCILSLLLPFLQQKLLSHQAAELPWTSCMLPSAQSLCFAGSSVGVLSIGLAVCLQIMTMTQAAIIMVQCHPHRPCPANFFDAVASEKGPLGPPRLLSDADNNALSNVLAAYWQYYQLVDPDKGCHVDHVPFIGSQSASLAPQFSLY